jgi:catechol 2,3-dioxygenase-like lactoylglutathione lyase family enzyme
VAATLALAVSFAITATCPLPADAASPTLLQALKYDGGFQEIIISVPDIDEAATFYQHVGGWRVIQRGAVQPETLTAWGLPDSVKGIEAVLQDPGNQNGFIRLIKFRGAPQEEARPSGHAWDTGGLAGFNVTTTNAQLKYLQFRQGGWHGYSQPVQVKHGTDLFVEAQMQGYAGEVVKLMQPANARPKPGEDKGLSAAFAAFATVTDIDVTLNFYTEKLGFKVYRHEDGPAGDPGQNPLGLPHNLINNVYGRTAFVHPQGDDPNNKHTGALVFTTYYGASGDDFSSRAKAPNYGIIGLRFAVSDADARLEQLKAKGITPLYEPTDIGMLPYGAVTAFAIRDPNGILLEFFEPKEKPTP